jgi:cytosine/adenosine deaminase-related metal-dependent hydrolase
VNTADHLLCRSGKTIFVTEIRSCTTPITLRARHVLPMAADPIENGWVRIERGRIAAIGRGQPSGPVADLGDAIILPGLVNAHTHLEFSDLDRPLPAGGGLPAWIERVVAMRRSRAASGTDEAARLVAAIASGIKQSSASGVTAIGEIATAAHPMAAAGGPLVRVFRETLGLSSVAMHAARSSLRRDLDRMIAEGTCIGISPHAP